MLLLAPAVTGATARHRPVRPNRAFRGLNVLLLAVAMLPGATALRMTGTAIAACSGARVTRITGCAPAAAASFEEQVKRRRNLAIISHPDAGKTTLTEKLLLYGGAIASAGAVKAKGEQRRATSDFMALEQERGISISSTVLSYEYKGKFVSILDTPGHQDFSEDTYRTLAAADNAVMLIDAAKGLEPQTKKLFEVARLRRLPLFTFVNKLDRPSRTPYELCDEIEAEFGVVPVPVLWPIGSGERFKGVLDRRSGTVALFERGERGKIAALKQIALDADELADEIGDEELYAQLIEDNEVLDELMPKLDMELVYSGAQTPVFFGSAMTNFGVQLFLDTFMDIGAPPIARALDAGDGDNAADFESGEISEDAVTIDPTSDQFSGFVFKLQANLDPKHRDRLAYVRVCSGSFTKGLKVKHSRLKGTEITLSQAQMIKGNERSSYDEESIAYPGDIIGLPNQQGNLCIGDTLYTGSSRISYAKIPSFSPEVFARCLCPSPSAAKNFNKGLTQLIAEGAVQKLTERGEEEGGGVPVLAAVGPLQLEVVQSRMSSEYNVDVTFERVAFTGARWALAGWDSVDAAAKENKLLNVKMLSDSWGRPVLLFPSEWRLNTVVGELGVDLKLRPHALAPDVEQKRRKK